MRRLPALLAASLLLVLGAAGCSSSSSDDAATTTAPTTVAGGDESTTTEATDTTDTTEAADDSSSTTDAEVTDADDAGCAALKKISDFDVESSKLINGGAEWSEIQAFFVDKTDDVLAAYDDAIATNPDVADDLTTLRDYTDGIDEIAAEATDLADLGAKLAEVPGVTEAGQAGLALNEYAQTNCGFSTGGN